MSDPQTRTPPRTVEEAAARITDISSLPHLTTAVMDVVNDADSSAADLQNAVESDPALMARILRQVSSAPHGLPVKVEGVHPAIYVLGFSEVWKLAVTASIAGRFTEETSIGGYDRPSLWKHMVSVAAGARLVASRAGLASFEKAFLAGLLHDLGWILLDQYVHAPFKRMLLALRDDTDRHEAEQRFIGFSHTELGQRVARMWGFPDVVVDAIRYHHRPEGCPGENRLIVQAVAIANYLASAKGFTSIGPALVERPSAATFSALSIDKVALRVLWHDYDEELRSFEGMLEV